MQYAERSSQVFLAWIAQGLDFKARPGPPVRASGLLADSWGNSRLHKDDAGFVVASFEMDRIPSELENTDSDC